MKNIHTFRGSLHINNHSLSAEVPDECPLCHRHSQTLEIQTNVTPEDKIQTVFQCGYSECKNYFIGYYEGTPPSILTLVNVSPALPKMREVSEVITKISPMFLEIYRQAEQAACLGLSQICGPGYRKAFEFLIKDYAKTLCPNEGEKIEKSLSVNVVSNYIDNERVKSTARRCLWLGNDETHYLRKWNDHDIQDLINLLHITIHWIELDQASKKYMDNMKE